MKDISKLQEEALLINESIKWTKSKADQTLSELESLPECKTLDCFKKQDVLLGNLYGFMSKLELEEKAIEKYGRDLQEAKNEVLNSGVFINF